jgi:hypothetical protein
LNLIFIHKEEKKKTGKKHRKPKKKGKKGGEGGGGERERSATGSVCNAIHNYETSESLMTRL